MLKEKCPEFWEQAWENAHKHSLHARRRSDLDQMKYWDSMAEFFASIPFFFTLFILILAVVHNPADRWFSLWCHLNEIQALLRCNAHPFPDRYNPKLLAVAINYPGFPNTDLFIDPQFFNNYPPPP
jgi:hypothetical protein